MLPHQFKRLIEALSVHSSTVEEGFKSQERAIRDAANEAQEKLGEVPCSITETIQRVADEQGEYEKAQRNKDYRQQSVIVVAACWTALFTALAFGAAAYYAHIARRQLDQMIMQYPTLKESADAAKDSADLARQVTESTQQAQVEANCGPSIELGNSYAVTCSLGNLGKSFAKKVRGEFRISVESYPSRKVIRELPILQLTVAQLGPVGGSASTASGSVVINGLDVQMIKDGKRAVSVSGSFSFDNGYGTTLSQSFCWEDIRVAIINSGYSGNDFWGDSFLPCVMVQQAEARNAYYAQHDLKGR